MAGKKFPQDYGIFPTRSDWRDWLVANHQNKKEIWIQIHKVHSEKEGVRLDEAVEEALCFGWIDGQMYSVDSDTFVIRMTPRRPGSIWSKRNRIRAEVLIASGRMTEAGLKAIREAQASGKWQTAYPSREALTLPTDLQAALMEYPLAAEHFFTWTHSQKLNAVHWLEESKRESTRTERLLKIILAARENRKVP